MVEVEVKVMDRKNEGMKNVGIKKEAVTAMAVEQEEEI